MDLVHEILARVKARIAEAYGLPEEVADVLGALENDLKREFGGERVQVHLPKPDLAAKAAAVTREYLDNRPVEEIASRHGISRRTLYNYLKRR